MKLSKYTLFFNDEDKFVVYNSLHDSIMICMPQIATLIQDHDKSIDAIERIHPSLFDYLIQKKFIVPNDSDETEEFISSMRQEFDDAREYSITINPTMNCNLRCWYCYEEHLAHSMMSSATMDAIRKLLTSVLSARTTKSLHLGFFGGEPLLGFNKCVDPLIRYADELCRKHAVDFSFSFTTNAVLLSRNICDTLYAYGRDVSFQIPFDGNREIHDSIKHTHNDKGTYDIVLANLEYALSKKFHVTARCNYTCSSVESFEDFIRDVTPLLEQYPETLKIAFQQVWQDAENGKASEIVEKLEDQIHKIGGRYYIPTIDASRCYADKRNSFVINYNGDIYQCTAREFNETNKEGILQSDGTILYNDRYRLRMESRFSNPECLECQVFPICNLCTQKRMERGNDKCLCSNYANYKDDLAISRIKSMYRFTHMNKSE